MRLNQLIQKCAIGAIVSFAFVTLMSDDAAAQVVMRNGQTGALLAAENGQVTTTARDISVIELWYFTQVGRGQFVYIQSAANGLYLNTEHGQLELGEVDGSWQSAMWQLEPVDDDLIRLRNRKKSEHVLHVTEKGTITAAPADIRSRLATWLVDGESVGGVAAYMQTDDEQVGQSDYKSAAQSDDDKQYEVAEQAGAYEGAAQSGQAVAYDDSIETQATETEDEDYLGSGEDARDGEVLLYFQNRSDQLLDVFVDDADGRPQFVFLIKPNYQVVQGALPGTTWRLAVGDDWIGGFVATDDDEQVINYP